MEATESPLDVLTRAASLVQESLPPDYDDVRRCMVKDLPSARWKRERRCREKHGNYAKIPEKCSSSENNACEDCNSSGESRTVPLVKDTPLDMSTRGRGSPPSYMQSVSSPGYWLSNPRPSVIAVAPPAQEKADVKQGNRREMISGVCDPVIDEHFRRSLGKDYSTLFSSSNSSSVTVTGLSVDDHFAKALGDTWVKLQASNNNTVSKIKEEKEEDKKSDSKGAPQTANTSSSLVNERRGLLSI